MYKSLCKSESYLKLFMSRKQRSLFAQTRAGILPLKIETGRFKNIKDSVTVRMRKMKVDERTCEICNSNAVENEIHFICECPVYENYRHRLYEEVSRTDTNFMNLPIQEKFVYLMENECKKLSLYIVDIWNVRNSVLYK